MYYFAYGSNMNHEQMKKRCPSGKFITRALLSGYKYVYDGYSSSGKGAVSNIIKSANRENYKTQNIKDSSAQGPEVIGAQRGGR